ncbi:MAG: MFS transporter [Proteobacteria bacterium]|nr:MFS transporter [Pseudomonadota bacterium]
MSTAPTRRAMVVTVLGIGQIFGWGSSFYLPAVLAPAIVVDTEWSFGWVVGGTSVGLLVAALVSPPVGAFIARRGGRAVLAAGSVFFAGGLTLMALAPNLPAFLGAWIIVGLAMGASLYDAAFAALARLYGREARAPITALTLFGGFASTLCWPLSAYLLARFGWRGTCLTYAAIHLCAVLPLHLLALRAPAPPVVAPAFCEDDGAADAGRARGGESLLVALLALILSLAAGIGSIVIVHLLIILQWRGADPAHAIFLGTLFGPAQVAGRLFESLFGRRYHPFWTLVASCVLMLVGLALLGSGSSFLAVAIVVYAAGYGVSWIARGTLPLALFGARRYAALVGRLATPSLVVQALAPIAGAFLIERAGIGAAVATLGALALVNVALIGVLWRRCRDAIGSR